MTNSEMINQWHDMISSWPEQETLTIKVKVMKGILQELHCLKNQVRSLDSQVDYLMKTKRSTETF